MGAWSRTATAAPNAAQLHRRQLGRRRGRRDARRPRPGDRRGRRPRPALGTEPTSTRRCAPHASAQPAWRDVPPQQRARAVLDLRDALVEHRDELAALVTADMGKTLDGRGAERSVAASSRWRPRQRSPTCSRATRSRVSPAGMDVEMVRQPVGVVAAITPVQLPGDDPALVPAVRDRHRQHLHPQAVRARPAVPRAHPRADRRDRVDPRRASSTSSTAAANASRRCSTTRASTRSPSSARPRRRG